MREKKDYVVVTFASTEAAMAMEKFCTEHAIRGRLIPVPSEISAGCGICWRMTKEDYASFRDRLPEIFYERMVNIRM